MWTMLQVIILNRSPMKGGQECDGRNSEMVTELQLCFVLLPNGQGRMNKRSWLQRQLKERE